MRGSAGLLAGWCFLAGGAACHDFSKIKPGELGGASDGGGGDQSDTFMPDNSVAVDGPTETAPVGPPPPSCSQPLACGGDHESCCTWVQVPGGMFSRGYDTSKVATQNGTKVVGWQEQSVARAFISPFGLDKYEVTVGRFRPFFNIYESWIAQRPVSTGEMHAGAPPHLPASGWNRDWSRDRTKYPGTKQELQDRLDSCNMSRLARPEDRIVGWLEDAAGTNDQKPMTCVGFYEALLFCIWDEGRLPTEAEWNFAAAGGALQQAYPWGTPGQDKFVGNPVETDRANVGPNTSTLGLREVGSFATGGGLWGHQDLAGNAYEWVHDTCQQDCAEYNVAMMAEPLEVTPGSRIVRGGSYLWGPVNARTAYRKRVADGIAVRYEDVGWRCARNLVRP